MMCPRVSCFLTALFLGSLAAHVALAAPRLPRATPESQGVSSAAILAFVDAADAQVDTMNSMMLVRHGRVVAEGWWTPYSADDPHMLYSLSKSFTSTAVGLAAAEGHLSIDDTVLKFFPGDAPAAPSENLKQMRVRDLLMMSTGHHGDAIAAFNVGAPGSAAARFLALPVEHKPGTHFVYNSPATFMQSAIVQSVTGQTVLDYLRPRLFEPLGIDSPTWEATPEGITLGMSGLSIRTEDIACFGQMLLQRGQWQGRQLVPAAWIDAATARQTSNGSNPASDWDQGYGYQFWRCRPGFARADGAFGQFCFVMPQYDAVLAITSGTRDMQSVMNLVWEKVLPALGDQALPDAPEDQRALTDRLGRLVVRAPVAAATSPEAANFAGRTYTFPTNARNIKSVTLDTTGAAPALIVRGAGYDGRPIAIGSDTWIRGRTSLGSDVEPGNRTLVDRAVAARGGWTAPDTFVAKLCFYETPYAITVKLQFGGDLVVLDGSYNVSFGPNDLPQLVGRASR
jgi:CubicO group peptidase (beta-lactamase class C family)